MTFLTDFIQTRGFKRFILLAAAAIFLYLTRSLFNLFFLTFVVCYLMYTVEIFYARQIGYTSKLLPKLLTFASFALIIAVLALGISNLLPTIIHESKAIGLQIRTFYMEPTISPLEVYIKGFMTKLYGEFFSDVGFGYVFKSVSGAGRFGFDVIFALMLSIFFLLERERIVEFSTRFKTSQISSFYLEIVSFGTVFIHSFGKVIETQIVIAIINGILSTIALWLMGFTHVLGLGIIILILGLIPVLGVILSLIPLCIIALSTGGFIKVIGVVIMIAVLHAIEAYFLNPKLMSYKTKLPVFYTFVILLASEQLFGVKGLFLGIPLFIFLLDVLQVKRE